MLKKTIHALLMSAVASGALVFAAGCSEDIEGNEQNHPTYAKAKLARDSAKYQDAADLLNDLLSKAPNSAFLHRELAQLYGDNLYNYPRAIYHYERYLELSKTLSEEDKNVIRSFIENCKRKSAEEMIRINPQLAPRQDAEIASQTAKIQEMEAQIQELKDTISSADRELEGLRAKYQEEHDKYVKSAESLASLEAKIADGTVTPAVTTSSATGSAVAAETAPVASATGDATIHVIQAGEYPGMIAKKYGISVKALMDANGLTEEKSTRLKIGQKLKIPKK